MGDKQECYYGVQGLETVDPRVLPGMTFQSHARENILRLLRYDVRARCHVGPFLLLQLCEKPACFVPRVASIESSGKPPESRYYK
jgi:hypothetical protein